jgi:hypothetical protein
MNLMNSCCFFKSSSFSRKKSNLTLIFSPLVFKSCSKENQLQFLATEEKSVKPQKLHKSHNYISNKQIHAALVPLTSIYPLPESLHPNINDDKCTRGARSNT